MLNPNDLKTWKILIVDDEPDNLEVIAQSLDFFGATVQTAKDGVLGLKILETYEANLILLDLSMPNMDGWEMRTKVKENSKTKHIPVIALTAHAMHGDRERALEAGFDGYLTKPVNVPTLVQDVKKVLLEHQAVKTTEEETAETTPIIEETAPVETPSTAELKQDIAPTGGKT
jgi:CheY-like chemotaxis protein